MSGAACHPGADMDVDQKVPEPHPTRKTSTYYISRWLFLRGMGLVYLIAILSLWSQIHGLVGSKGILPADDYLDAIEQQLEGGAFWRLPTVCWWLGAGDETLTVLCSFGTVLALLLIVGVATMPVLVALWIIYLSLSQIGQVFLSFQWDTLLLESGFFAIFLAPLTLRPGLARDSRPSALARWMLWWLLFKLMFLSGITKLLSGDSTWRDLTALNFHYYTQPIPNWISWFAHLLPEWFDKASVVLMYFVEVIVPFGIIGPRRVRHIACLLMILFQLSIEITGNYGFFNLLSIVLCLPLLDDLILWRLCPSRWRATLRLDSYAFPDRSGVEVALASGGREEQLSDASERGNSDVAARLILRTAQPTRFESAVASVYRLPWRRARRWSLAIVAAVLLTASVMSFLREMVRTGREEKLSASVVALLNVSDDWLLTWGEPYLLEPLGAWRTINGYGLFRVMTTTRPEIILEGTHDGIEWIEYEFRWKPGDVSRRPAIVAPHQPRLDWQMWFAALHPQGSLHWLTATVKRLLEGSPEVIALLEDNSLTKRPPKLIRLAIYEYEFSPPGSDGRDWWVRTNRQPLTRAPISLQSFRQ